MPAIRGLKLRRAAGKAPLGRGERAWPEGRPAQSPGRGMRVAVIAAGSPRKRNTWSGIPFHVLVELQRRYQDVHAIENPILDFVLRRLLHRLTARWFAPRIPLVTGLFAVLVERALEKLQPDLVVCVNASHKVVDLKRDWPLILVEDAPFDVIVDYYGRFRRLGAGSRIRGNAVEQATIDRSHAVLLASEWARREAERTLDYSRTRLRVAPLGANLDEDPEPDPVAPRPAGGELRLLFVGYDWMRKGGPLVLDTLAELRRRSVNVSLHIVGSQPAAARNAEGVVLHGRLRKQIPEEAALLNALYRQSSFFFMPTRQEAYGLVYCEACAFGLPIVATRTGGVGEIVRDGENGRLLSETASATDYADAIQAIWANPALYARMQANARRAFTQRVNWTSWGDALEEVLGGAATRARAG